jgi:chromosome segregation ATPase
LVKFIQDHQAKAEQRKQVKQEENAAKAKEAQKLRSEKEALAKAKREEAMTEHKKQSLERQCAFLKKRLDRIPPGDNGPSAYAMRTADKYQKLCGELP